MLYKATDFYAVDLERSLRWDDPSVAVNWPSMNVVLSAKDQTAGMLHGT
jgi:dTDP-4-dehydrorhamnose 3,5-epimerase